MAAGSVAASCDAGSASKETQMLMELCAQQAQRLASLEKELLKAQEVDLRLEQELLSSRRQSERERVEYDQKLEQMAQMQARLQNENEELFAELERAASSSLEKELLKVQEADLKLEQELMHLRRQADRERGEYDLKLEQMAQMQARFQNENTELFAELERAAASSLEKELKVQDADLKLEEELLHLRQQYERERGEYGQKLEQMARMQACLQNENEELFSELERAAGRIEGLKREVQVLQGCGDAYPVSTGAFLDIDDSSKHRRRLDFAAVAAASGANFQGVSSASSETTNSQGDWTQKLTRLESGGLVPSHGNPAAMLLPPPAPGVVCEAAGQPEVLGVPHAAPARSSTPPPSRLLAQAPRLLGSSCTPTTSVRRDQAHYSMSQSHSSGAASSQPGSAAVVSAASSLRPGSFAATPGAPSMYRAASGATPPRTAGTPPPPLHLRSRPGSHVAVAWEASSAASSRTVSPSPKMRSVSVVRTASVDTRPCPRDPIPMQTGAAPMQTGAAATPGAGHGEGRPLSAAAFWQASWRK